jgi:hypothetical protein
MAKYKAWYASEDEIPQFARDNALYVNRNGRWEFDHGEFEQLEELTSPGLAANKATLLQEKKDANNALTAEKTRADNAEAELRKLQKPGTKIVSQEDDSLFQDYKALGAPKDLKKIKDEHAEQKSKLDKLGTEGEVRKLCEEAKLNFEATNDFMSSDKAKGSKIFLKDVKEKDASGKEIIVKKPFISVEKDEGNGRFKSEEFELKTFAEKNLPGYLAKSLFDVEEAAPEDNKRKVTPGVRIPSLSAGQSKDTEEGDVKPAVEKFNQRRDSRRMPWEKTEAAAQK